MSLPDDLDDLDDEYNPEFDNICPICDGDGCEECDEEEVIDTDDFLCPKCEGSGTSWDWLCECSMCHGDGCL